jgi:hypothetical protein
MGNIHNVMVVANSDTPVDSVFSTINKFLKNDAADAYGFVSRNDSAIVINYDNHRRKPEMVEGALDTEGADTLNHEIGHILGNDFSQTKKFRKSYYADLKRIEKSLKKDVTLNQLLEYLKHYTEGADFSSKITKKDVTERGLKENFAECFSMIADTNPSQINQLYANLFPNSMKAAFEFVI